MQHSKIVLHGEIGEAVWRRKGGVVEPGVIFLVKRVVEGEEENQDPLKNVTQSLFYSRQRK
jgi:hypothetical protein